ncbi:uncharacterized protein LOC119185020 isoform X3 [Rhipicephalus microplus]|uniref:uncharacterized protein LOC119185020 isoform X3 n=1 Tax=Rhipicephalus microplus TaxID=6941 RepID=UPI003F6B2CE2
MISETPVEVPSNEPCSSLPDLSDRHPKETATDTWSTRERLCLASSVLRSGDQNWVSVSRAIRPLGEANRPNDWFSQKNCALQYADLLKTVESPKRKRGDRGDLDTPGDLIVRNLTLERIEELKKLIEEEKQQHKQLQEDIQLILSGSVDDDLVKLLQDIEAEDVPGDTIDRELENLSDCELELEVLKADVQPPSCSKTVPSSSMQEMQRNSSQSEHSEPDSMVGSPICIEVEDPLTPQVQEIPEVERPCTPQPKVVSPLPHVTSCTPPTPPAVSTSLLTSLLKSPTPSSPVSSVTGLRSLTPFPVHQLKEQSSPRSHLTPSFFNQSAARQLATCTLSPCTSSTTVQRFSPTSTTADGVLRSSILQMSPHSATSSAPTLSKLLELPPSTPGGCLPSLPFLTTSPAVLSPVASQVTTFSPLESSNSIDTTSDDTKFTADDAKFTADGAKFTAEDAKFTADDARLTADDAKFTADDAKFTAGEAMLTADDARLPVGDVMLTSDAMLTADDARLTADDARLTADDARLTADNARLTTDNASVPGLVLSPVKQTVEGMTTPLVSEPSETPCEVPVVETVESQPEPLPAPSLAPEEPMEIIEDVPEDVPPREMEAKVESKEEVLEEDVDRTVSPAEGEPVMETVASEEMVAEAVIEDSLSSSIIVDDDKESVQLEPEHGTCAEQETKPESEVNKEAVEAPVEEACLESGSKDKDDRDEKDDMDYQPAADESDSAKDAAKSDANNDEAPLESPDVLSKKDEQTSEDDLQEDPQLTAHEDDDDAEESKDAWAPGTVSSPSPGEETMYDTRSEDDGDDKLKDDKSSIDDARTKTPETPSGTEPDMKDDASQHMESGTEDGSGDLSKHLLGSVGDSVPNSPASVLQGEDSEVVRDYKVWKKAIMLVWRAAANHKFANVFLHPVTEEMAPGYHSIVHRPMDLLTIKKNIENGCIRTTLEFQRDMMLMFQNAIMYNNSDHDVFHMAIEMRKEVMRHIQLTNMFPDVLVNTLVNISVANSNDAVWCDNFQQQKDFLATQLMVQTTETKILRGRDGRERKVEYSLDDKEGEALN